MEKNYNRSSWATVDQGVGSSPCILCVSAMVQDRKLSRCFKQKGGYKLVERLEEWNSRVSISSVLQICE